jgi:hypothetical protein
MAYAHFQNMHPWKIYDAAKHDAIALFYEYNMSLAELVDKSDIARGPEQRWWTAVTAMIQAHDRTLSLYDRCWYEKRSREIWRVFKHEYERSRNDERRLPCVPELPE